MTLPIPKAGLSCLLLSGSLVLGSGCSYAFVHGPPPNFARQERSPGVPQTERACTSSNAAPIVDTVLGSALVGFGGFLVIASVASHHSSGAPPNTGFLIFTQTQSSPSSLDDSSWEEAGVAVGAAAVGLGALFLASAVTGYGRTADCRGLEESPPGGSHPSARHLLDLNGIVAARTREELLRLGRGSESVLGVLRIDERELSEPPDLDRPDRAWADRPRPRVAPVKSSR